MEHFPKAHRWFHAYIQKPLCDWYQGHVEKWLLDRDRPGEPRQTCLMVLIPREFAKTSIITQAGHLWLHVRDPNIATALGAETSMLAQKMLATIKTIMAGKDENAWFTWLYGNWLDKTRKWRDEFIVHAARRATARHDYSINTWGVATGLLGAHPDALFFDDPTSYDAIASDAQWLDKVNAHVATLLPVQRADALLVWVGTRYGDNDHFGKQFELNGMKSLTGMAHPTVAPKKDGKWEVYYMSARDLEDTKDFVKGRPTFPEQWPEWRLLEAERTDPQKYAAQLLNDPTLSQFNPLQMHQVEECMVDENNVPYNILHYSMHLDTAFKTPGKQNRGDESVIQVWGHQLGTGIIWYIEGYSSNVWRAEDFYKKVGELMESYYTKKRKIFVVTADLETGGQRGSINHAIVNECRERKVPVGFRYEMLSRGGTKKADRMLAPFSFWANGFVKLRRNAPGIQKLTKQVTTIQSILAGGGHDDWADCAADAFHPKVYRPLFRIGPSQVMEAPMNPYDEELQGSRGPSITQLYDAYVIEDDPTAMPLI
jgi:hypothetical protein